MCLGGIAMHTISLSWPKWSASATNAFVETCIYVSMGWLVVVAFDQLAESFSPCANLQLLAGKSKMCLLAFRRIAVYDRVTVLYLGLR